MPTALFIPISLKAAHYGSICRAAAGRSHRGSRHRFRLSPRLVFRQPRGRAGNRRNGLPVRRGLREPGAKGVRKKWSLAGGEPPRAWSTLWSGSCAGTHSPFCSSAVGAAGHWACSWSISFLRHVWHQWVKRCVSPGGGRRWGKDWPGFRSSERGGQLSRTANHSAALSISGGMVSDAGFRITGLYAWPGFATAREAAGRFSPNMRNMFN